MSAFYASSANACAPSQVAARKIGSMNIEAHIAAVDTEYQAAVERNDAATMDRILADDFILVTGMGKVYTKKDLLDEARSRRVVYEHQRDTNQTVRVWGDTPGSTPVPT